MIVGDVKLTNRNHIKSLLIHSTEEIFIKYKEKISREIKGTYIQLLN